MPSAQLRLPPEPESVGVARRVLRERLTDWGIDGLEFQASQALTELATNAVLHARTEFNVMIEWADGVLRVCVADESAKLPVQRSYALDATTGRGLALVSRLCRSWGVERAGGGKQVWFEIAPGVEAEDDVDTDAEALLAAFADDDEDAVSGALSTKSGGWALTTRAA